MSETPRPGWPVSPGFIWRAGFIVMALVFIFLFITFLIEDGGGVIFTVLMAWFFALAMAPAVDRLSRRMRRGVATILVMLGLVFAFGGFGQAGKVQERADGRGETLIGRSALRAQDTKCLSNLEPNFGLGVPIPTV